MSCFLSNLVEYSDSVDKFHAILFHQRSFSLHDKPSTRRPEQRYVHWSFESPVHRYSTVQYSTVQYSTVPGPQVLRPDRPEGPRQLLQLEHDLQAGLGLPSSLRRHSTGVEYLPYRRRAMRIIYFLLFSRWSLYLREMN